MVLIKFRNSLASITQNNYKLLFRSKNTIYIAGKIFDEIYTFGIYPIWFQHSYSANIDKNLYLLCVCDHHHAAQNGCAER